MATNAKGPSRVRRSIILTIKSAVLLVEVAALGYVALVLVKEVSPSLEASSEYALESEMSEAPGATVITSLQPVTESAAATLSIQPQ